MELHRSYQPEGNTRLMKGRACEAKQKCRRPPNQTRRLEGNQQRLGGKRAVTLVCPVLYAGHGQADAVVLPPTSWHHTCNWRVCVCLHLWMCASGVGRGGA